MAEKHTVRGWVRDAERDVSDLEKLDAETLLKEFASACTDVHFARKGNTAPGEYSPAFARATQKAIVLGIMLGEACARETAPAMRQ